MSCKRALTNTWLSGDPVLMRTREMPINIYIYKYVDVCVYTEWREGVSVPPLVLSAIPG